jgi:hypothetical protein
MKEPIINNVLRSLICASIGVFFGIIVGNFWDSKYMNIAAELRVQNEALKLEKVVYYQRWLKCNGQLIELKTNPLFQQYLNNSNDYENKAY